MVFDIWTNLFFVVVGESAKQTYSFLCTLIWCMSTCNIFSSQDTHHSALDLATTHTHARTRPARKIIGRLLTAVSFFRLYFFLLRLTVQRNLYSLMAKNKIRIKWKSTATAAAMLKDIEENKQTDERVHSRKHEINRRGNKSRWRIANSGSSAGTCTEEWPPAGSQLTERCCTCTHAAWSDRARGQLRESSNTETEQFAPLNF